MGWSVGARILDNSSTTGRDNGQWPGMTNEGQG